MTPPCRLAILKPSALGDIVHALPVLSALRDAWPETHISWVVNRGFEGLLTGHPDLNATIPFERNAFRGNVVKGLSYGVQFLNRLRREHFDMVLDLQGLLRTGLMCAGSGAPVRIGFQNAREGSRHFLTHTVSVPDADRIHAVDRYRRVLDFLGVPKDPLRVIVPVSPAELEAARMQLSAFPKPWLAVAVGAKWLTKRWPVPSFATVLQAFQSRTGGTAILVGSPDDIPLSLDLASRLTGPILDLTGKTMIPRLVAVLKLADVMLANDTGPLHLAVALGTKCVAPYTCTRIALHGPYGQSDNAVATQVDCAGSYLRICPNGLKCFTELTPDRVLAKLERVC
jgi:heptosyltransferase I